MPDDCGEAPVFRLAGARPPAVPPVAVAAPFRRAAGAAVHAAGAPALHGRLPAGPPVAAVRPAARRLGRIAPGRPVRQAAQHPFPAWHGVVGRFSNPPPPIRGCGGRELTEILVQMVRSPLRWPAVGLGPKPAARDFLSYFLCLLYAACCKLAAISKLRESIMSTTAGLSGRCVRLLAHFRKACVWTLVPAIRVAKNAFQYTRIPLFNYFASGNPESITGNVHWCVAMSLNIQFENHDPRSGGIVAQDRSDLFG
jgi:hypothetical protein